jgi:hypothetical protein
MFNCLLDSVLGEFLFSANCMLPFTLITAPLRYSYFRRRKTPPVYIPLLNQQLAAIRC